MLYHIKVLINASYLILEKNADANKNTKIMLTTGLSRKTKARSFDDQSPYQVNWLGTKDLSKSGYVHTFLFILFHTYKKPGEMYRPITAHDWLHREDKKSAQTFEKNL